MATQQAEELAGEVAEGAVDTTVRIGEQLDQVALVVGTYRISVLDVLTVFVTAVALYIAATLILWVLKRGIRRAKRFDPTSRVLG